MNIPDTGHMDTIFALSSGTGRAGVAVVRLSGPQSFTVAAALAGRLPPPRQARLASLHDPLTRELIDRGLMIVFPGPRSFTGEDVVEFHVHGGRATLRALMAVLASQQGLRAAQAGEFTRRALLHGKMDLAAVEGLADLLEAETALQRRQAQRQADGQLSSAVRGWREALIAVRAILEAQIDFADEDDVRAQATILDVRDRMGAIREALAQALRDCARARRIRDGWTIVIAGPPNAGKSSLLNSLARQNIAIVSPEAGTTRDPIAVDMELDGMAVTLIDTAGLRDADSAVEQEGIDRARAKAQSADLVLWVTDNGNPRSGLPELNAPVLTVRTKIDLDENAMGSDHAVSVRTGEGLAELMTAIATLAAQDAPAEHALIVHDRQRLRVEAAIVSLDRGIGCGDEELIAEALRLAQRELEEIIGWVGVEQVLDAVFSRFCVGK